MDILINSFVNLFDNLQADYNIKYGSFQMQGRREYMEDTKRIVKIKLQYINTCYLVILCDGHAGGACSKYIINKLPLLLSYYLKTIYSTTTYQEINKLISETIKKLDSMYQKQNDLSGSTCVFALFINKNIFIVNIGDSRCIIGNYQNKIKLQTKDHKPNVKKELQRIYQNGGLITNIDTYRVYVNEQVNGLAISRVIGDNHYKGFNIVISNPDIYVRNILRKNEIMILASDGLWDVVTNLEAINFVNTRINKMGLSTIAKDLVYYAFRKGSMDNITAIIVMI